MKPDKPGVWHSRRGYTALGAYWGGMLRFFLVRDNSFQDGFDGDVLRYKSDDLPNDEWLLLELPEFPTQPDPPMRVYAYDTETLAGEWWHWSPAHGKFYCGISWERGSRLTAIPHPDNDPEAVRLIERDQ